MDERLRRSFCVPFNGDLELVRTVVEGHAEAVFEFYGSDNAFGSGRWSRPEDSATIPEVMRELEGSGIHFNYLLNSIVLDDYAVRADELKRHLSMLREVGVQSVVCASPFLVDLVKELGFEACTSLMQHIRSEVSVRYYEDLHYDRILVCEDDIRNVDLIESLAGSTRLPLEVIVDNCCLMECPFRLTHLNSEGIRHHDFHAGLRHYMSAYSRQCKQLWHQDPTRFLQASWVRPEELPKLKALGVDLFKMGGRGLPSAAIVAKLAIYKTASWGGSVLDYLKPYEDPVGFFGIEHIENRSLDDFFQFFFSGNCSRRCGMCGHCKRWAEQAVRMVPNHWRNRPISGGVGELARTQGTCTLKPGEEKVANTWVFGRAEPEA